MGSVFLFLYQKIVVFIGIVCLSIYKYLVPLFGSHIFRKDEGSEKEKLEYFEISSSIETESKSKHDLGNFTDGFSEKEETEFCLQFKFPSYEEFCKKSDNREESSTSESIKGLSGFIEKTNILELTDKKDEPFEDIEKINKRVLSVDENNVEIISEEAKELPKEPAEREIVGEESVLSSPFEPFTNPLLDTSSDGFLSHDDFGDECEIESEHELLNEVPKLDEIEKDLINEEHMYTLEELKNIEEAHYKIVGKFKTDFSEKDFCGESESDSKKAYSENKPGLVKPYEKEKNSVDVEDTYTIEELRKIEEAHYKIIGKSKPEILPKKDICVESESDFNISYSKNKSELVKSDKNKKTSLNMEDTFTIEELRKIEEAHYQTLGKFKPEFLPKKDFCGEGESNSEISHLINKTKSVTLEEGENNLANEEHNYTIEELKKIEESHYKNLAKFKPELLSEKDFCGESESHSKKFNTINKSKTATLDKKENNSANEEDKYTNEEAHYKNEAIINSGFLSEKDFYAENKSISIKADTKNKSEWDSDELWEHQELIDQLKMELKKVKATGLPTILEESEYPKISDDLKPWKMDEHQHADRTGELQRLYKSYADRMRKLDILNYQKMYAIGFLQLKDPLQSISSVSTLLTHNLFPSKCKRVGNDPMMKFIVELQSDLEIVYVGHMCLSWEILHWQYGEALELWETDPRGARMYNDVAGDFQQFQVLMQRFIEDEPFQGPRLQNYVKSRCAFRNLLQVPLIKEDNLKDKKKALKRREMGDFAITNDTLVEILEESIRIFWRFVRADKDCVNMMVKTRKGVHIQLQDPSDSDLLMEVHANLQKKEKRLKDILRGGNCILNKFKKKSEEDDSDQVLYFFSQVDMKLVSRVLNMPRIRTDQLIWCRNKLDKIRFVSKKIQVEPSFLLFPC